MKSVEKVDYEEKLLVLSRDVEAVIFQTLPLPPLPLPLTKSEKTAVDNFFLTFVSL